MTKHYPLMYLFEDNRLIELDGSSIMRFLTAGDDKVFIVNGRDEEIYLIEDEAIILKLETITNIYPEAEAMALILPMLNPEKYGR